MWFFPNGTLSNSLPISPGPGEGVTKEEASHSCYVAAGVYGGFGVLSLLCCAIGGRAKKDIEQPLHVL